MGPAPGWALAKEPASAMGQAWAPGRDSVRALAPVPGWAADTALE